MHIVNKTVDMPLVVDDIGPRAPGKTFASPSGLNGPWVDLGGQLNVDAGMRVRFCGVPEPTRTSAVRPFAPRHWARLPLVPKKH